MKTRPLQGTRIAVTGASGFLGRHTLAPLVNLGFEVHALSRRSPLPSDHIHSSQENLRWHSVDIENPESTRAWLETYRPEYLLHFAWYTEHGKFWQSQENVQCLAESLQLLSAFAAAGGKRFIGAGTCAEYDWSGFEAKADGPAFDELTTPLRPTTLYGATKASAYLTGSALAKTLGLSFAWGRIFHLFGEGEPEGRIVPSLIRAHVKKEILACSQGTQRRDFLSASEVGSAFAHLAASSVNGAVNIGSGDSITLRQMSDLIGSIQSAIDNPNSTARPISQNLVQFGSFHDSGPDNLVPKIHRLQNEVGWKPAKDLKSELSQWVRLWQNPS